MKSKILGIIILLSIIVAGCVKEGEEAQVVLQSISFTPDTLKITAGRSVQLSPVFAPAVFSSIGVDWKSTDESVATISSGGYLAAKKAGKTWVSIKDKNSATVGKCYIIVE